MPEHKFECFENEKCDNSHVFLVIKQRQCVGKYAKVRRNAHLLQFVDFELELGRVLVTLVDELAAVGADLLHPRRVVVDFGTEALQ